MAEAAAAVPSGSTPSYDLLVLLLGMSAVAAIRVLRRRNEQ